MPALQPSSSLKPMLSRLLEPARRNAQLYQRRRIVFGLIAVVAFPLYWVVWRYLYPQPYENLALRLTGAALCLPLMFSPYWPQRLQAYVAPAWYLVLLYCLPFFFTYMMLMNGATDVWVESLLVAVFAMILALDALMLVLLFMTGTTLAWCLYLATSEAPMALAAYGQHLWVIAFAMVFGTAVNFASARVRAEQERAMLATAGSVAHELRTPLISIKAGAGGLRNHLPQLIEAYVLARAQGLPVPAIREPHLESLRGVLDRIEREADYSNAIIDMLVTNVRGAGHGGMTLSPCSMQACIATALQRYPFAGQERERITVEGDDFTFQGDALLMVHVLFNLLKNALRHMALAGHGEIGLRMAPGDHEHRLVFRDTGSGIAPEILPHVFERFYSGTGSANGISGDGVLGSGIGLAFCHDMVTAFGGRIVCRSQAGAWTEFELTFPALTLPPLPLPREPAP